MGLKPIPLAAYSRDFQPPVTGVGGRPNPVANLYDSSGIFPDRHRAGSFSKKRRLDEIDQVFNLSVPYPPLNIPGRQVLSVKEINTLLVAATAAGEEAKPILESPDIDPKMKAFGNLSLALLRLVESIVERGIVPLSGSVSSPGEMGGHKAAAPPAPPKPVPGLRELRESLEKSDTESVLFEANLGQFSIGNRSNLCSAFSNGIRAAAIGNAEAKGADPAEAVRVMNDALDCVTEMDFIGLRSEKTRQKDEITQEPKTHFTMPIKLKFEDRNSRLHFERSVKATCGLRAVMSLPKNIREEQSLFAKALRERYHDEMVTVRPDIGSLHFIAFRKKATEKRWTKCSESMAIPHGILLSGYKVRSSVTLPPTVDMADSEGAMSMEIPQEPSLSQS
jgi:hypothetical protein